MRHVRPPWLCAALILLMLPVRGWGSGEQLVLAAKYGPQAIVTTESRDALVQRTAAWLRDFLRQRSFAVADGSVAPEAASDRLWALETADSCPIAKSFGIDCPSLYGARTDAYMLSIGERGGQRYVCVVGADAAGIRAGVARLIALLRDSGNEIIAPVVTETRRPFFAKRELVVANRGMVFMCTQFEGAHWRTWSDDRIRKYAEQIWLLGFNSLQTHEGRYYRASTAAPKRLEETVHKTRVLMEAARSNGLQVSQLIWGQSPYNKRLCWNSLDDRKIMEEELTWMAATYGKYVDRVVINFRDPGGCPRKDCNKCDDYRTPQQIAAFIREQYRKINPHVTITLSTWQAPAFWKGEPGVEFLDETYCPKDVAIALHKWYDTDRAKRVRDARRKVDIWSWYVTDHETTTDMSLCMTRVDSYYSALPQEASWQIDLVSNEMCFHGWPNILSAYVTGQKMWDPHRSLAEIEREFCAGVFGEDNADAMVALYQACELVVNPARGDSRLPDIRKVFGNPDYNKRFRAALEAGRKVKLEKSFRPTFTTATDPQSIVDYLVRNLSLVTVLSEAQEKVNVAKRTGASREALEKIVNEAVAATEPYKADLDYPGLVQRLRRSVSCAHQER